MRQVLLAFVLRQPAQNWAGPILVVLAVILVLFALAGEIANAPFVYSQPT